MVKFTNTIERDYLYLLDYSSDVLAFEERPLAIEYQHEGKALQFAPSFSVRQLNRVVLVACEEYSRVRVEPKRRALDAAKAWCAENGCYFQVVTDHDILATRRIENIKFLTYYARHTVDLDTRARIYGALSRGDDQLSILQLAAAINFPSVGSASAAIYSMAFHHELFIQLDHLPLSEDSLVSLPPQQSDRSDVL